MKTFLIAVCFALFLMLPSVVCTVTLGGGSGSVTLINPDNSSFTFNSENETSFTYLSNAPDGWWNISTQINDDDLWILGVVFGVIAIGLVVGLVTMKNRSNQN
jgi:hypothetical protein